MQDSIWAPFPTCLHVCPLTLSPHLYIFTVAYILIASWACLGSWSVWKIQHYREEDRKLIQVSTFIAFSGMKFTVISLLSVLSFDKRKGFELILSFCPGSRKELIEAPLCGTTCPCVQNHMTTRILEDDWDLGWFLSYRKLAGKLTEGLVGTKGFISFRLSAL